MAVRLSFPAEVLRLLILPSPLRHMPMNSSDSVFLSLSPSILTVRRRQELRELRLLQKEEHRNQAQLNSKHQLQLEQMLRRFEQEMTVPGQGRASPDTCWFRFSPADALQTLAQGDALGVAVVLGHLVRRERDHQGNPSGLGGGMCLWGTEPSVGIKHRGPAGWEALAVVTWRGGAGQRLFWTFPLQLPFLVCLFMATVRNSL